MNKVEITNRINGKFYTAELGEMANEVGVKVSIDVIKLVQLYGTSIRKVQIFIPLSASPDEDNVPDVEELTIDQVPVKLELLTDNSERYNNFEPKVIKYGDSKEDFE